MRHYLLLNLLVQPAGGNELVSRVGAGEAPLPPGAGADGGGRGGPAERDRGHRGGGGLGGHVEQAGLSGISRCRLERSLKYVLFIINKYVSSVYTCIFSHLLLSYTSTTKYVVNKSIFGASLLIILFLSFDSVN